MTENTFFNPRITIQETESEIVVNVRGLPGPYPRLGGAILISTCFLTMFSIISLFQIIDYMKYGEFDEATYVHIFFTLILFFIRRWELNRNKYWSRDGEKIEIEEGEIRIKRKMNQWMISKIIKAEDVKHVFVAYRNRFFEEIHMANLSYWRMYHWGYGRINIDLGGRNVAFAMDVSHADAEIILDRIARKFPHYVPDRQTG